jgi:glycosyltransferase involved in cell wall biosynthesis
LILTFAIPVFNDPEALRLTLSSVFAASDVPPNTFEVIVSDNHSDDDSFQVAQVLLQSISNSKAVRQESNLGFAGNLKALTELATGEYIWFLAAGDLLMPDQLKKIAEALVKTKPDFGVVNGLFEYHQNWRSFPTLHSYSTSDANNFSTTPLFSHAISLNIISRKVMNHYWETRFFKRKPSGVGQESEGSYAFHQPGSPPRETHWPHLEAVCQTIIDDSSGSVKWMEYQGLSVLLGRNKNGDWDKRASALEVFGQWADIIDLTNQALPKSHWLSEMNRKLHGRHLLEFLFGLRKDGTLGKITMLKQALAMPIRLQIKVASATVALLPKLVIRFLVCTRGLWIKIRGPVQARIRLHKGLQQKATKRSKFLRNT